MLGIESWGRSPPRVKDLVLRLDMITGGESLTKMSERHAAFYGVNSELRDPQMHKHTELGKHKLISGTIQWILIYKTKSFCFFKKRPLREHNGGLVFQTRHMHV